MKSPRTISRMVGRRLGACMVLLPWMIAAAAGEQASSYSETKLTAADGAERDFFAWSVAISGDTAVMGAPRNDDDAGIGAAYVFRRDRLDPSRWTQTAKLTAADGEPGDHFGTAVGISDHTAVIGAAYGRPGGSADVAYIFERDLFDHTVWTQTAKLTGGDRFGLAVAISGHTAVIGAPSEDAIAEASGVVYIFERDPFDSAVWTQTARLMPADGERGDGFGTSVAIFERTAVIGASEANDVLQTDTGAAYVFERDPLDPAVWTQTAKLKALDRQAFDNFGVSAAIAENTAVIGAYFDDDRGPYSGSAYVFERDPLDPAVWRQTAKLRASDGDADDRFGIAVATSGQTAVIGASYDEDLGYYSGSAYVFQRDARDFGAWTQTAQITASDGNNGDHFGNSVAISGQTAVIGSYWDDERGFNSGSAYMYSPQVCELELVLEPLTVRAGEELRVAVDLHHRRPITVTVPFLLWLEDVAGQVVAQKSSPPVTMEPGDHRKLRLAVTLPPSLPPGTYRVLVGVRHMQQGIAWASQQFEIVE